MYRKGESELALLKGMEVKLNPLMAVAYMELEPAMIRTKNTNHYQNKTCFFLPHFSLIPLKYSKNF
jgi:hypothetical protein